MGKFVRTFGSKVKGSNGGNVNKSEVRTKEKTPKVFFIL